MMMMRERERGGVGCLLGGSSHFSGKLTLETFVNFV